MKNSNYIILFFLLIGHNLVAQKTKESDDYITDLRPKYNSEVIFSNENANSNEVISFTNTINDSMKLYTDSVKNIYNSREIYIKGYSVMAYNGSDKEEGMKIRSQILKYFPETNVTLDYISPNFKLKVGPFEEKLDAVRIKEGMLKRGLSSALIVPENILIKKP